MFGELVSFNFDGLMKALVKYRKAREEKDYEFVDRFRCVGIRSSRTIEGARFSMDFLGFDHLGPSESWILEFWADLKAIMDRNEQYLIIHGMRPIWIIEKARSFISDRFGEIR